MGKVAVTALVVASFSLLAAPAMAEIEVFDASSLEPSFDRFHEIDFEDIRLEDDFVPPPEPVVTSLLIRGVTFTDPSRLSTGFCSSPTCFPDPDNPQGGNNELFLNPGGEISFASSPRLVVLDIQGMGDQTFELLVTDRLGQTLTVNSQGVPSGRNLLGLRTGDGVQKITVTSTGGGNQGPVPFARILFSQSGRLEAALQRPGALRPRDR